MSAYTSRGLRNFNPTNIRVNPANKWQGRAAPHERSAAQAQEREFEVFLTPEWGIRAAAVLITNYYDRHGLHTIRGIITRWAPNNENNTEAYIAAVSRRMEEMPDAHLPLHDYETMRKLIVAIIWHENGEQPYSAAIIDKGLAMAGFVRPDIPAPQSGTVIGGLASTATSAGALAVSLVEGTREMQDALQPFGTMDTVRYVLIALAVISAAATVYMRVREHQRMV